MKTDPTDLAGLQAVATEVALRTCAGRLTVHRLTGLVPYLPMWSDQRTLATARRHDEISDLLLLLEHEHVYTNGRHGSRANLLLDEEELAQLGLTYQVVDRGGDITYHGPGQLVGYPIVHLTEAGLGVRAYIERLEASIIEVAAHFGVEASALPGYTGVWVGNEKLAAIGVRVRQGVAYHGFALNVATDLSYVEHIVPCGIQGRGVTSLSKLLGRDVTVEEVAPICAQAVAEAIGLRLTCTSPASAAVDHKESARHPATL